jgi:phage terminase large subunit
VNAARVLIGKIEFNAAKCERGLDGLRSWSYEYNEQSKIFSSDPLHDWASHDGDGFSYGCLVMQMTRPPEKPAKPRFATDATFAEMVEENRRRRLGEE